MRKTSPIVFLGLGLVLLAVVVASVLVVQRAPRKGEAQFSGQANLSYGEQFDTDTFNDAGETTAQWDTANGLLTLDTSAGGFYKADRTTLGADLIAAGHFNDSASAVSSFGDANTVVLDSNGYPNIVWNDNEASREVFFSRWDGAQWVKMDGTPGSDNLSNTPFTSVRPNIALDASDNPHVVWMDEQFGGPEAFDVFHVRWDGLTWSGMSGGGPDNVSATASPPDVSNEFAQIQVDSAGTPHVAWQSGPVGSAVDKEIMYGFWTGTRWAGLFDNPGSDPDNLTIAHGTGSAPSFALDSLGRPAFVWQGSIYNINFTRWNGSAYVMADGVTPGVENVSGGAGLPASGFYLSFVLDSDDQPYVAFTMTTTPGGRGTGRDNVYVTRYDTSLNDWATVDRVTPTPGFSNATNYGAGRLARQSSPALDDQNNPAVALFDLAAPGDAFFVRYNGSAWVGADRSTPGVIEVTGSGSFDGEVNHELDALGNPAIAFGGTHSTLSPGTPSVFFTQWIEPCSTPGVAQSLTVDTSADPILSATLVADAQTLGGTITYALSNDGGATFETVTPGTPHTFTSAGSDLRWRATLAADGPHPGLCPSIDSLTLDYVTQEPQPSVPAPGPATQVVRVQGNDPVELAINTSQARFSQAGSAAAVVVARSDVISDALAVTPYANLKNASLLLTPPDSTPASVVAEITRVLGSGSSGKTVYLAGGQEALSQQVETDLAAAGFTSQLRFPGANRRETARLIANQIMLENPTPVTHAFVSEDQAFVDTLGLGSIAGQKVAGSVRPILLTQRGEPTPDVSLLTFLAEHPTVTTLEIAGGVAAVPEEVATLIQQQTQVVSVARSQGVDRYATNQAFNAKYYTSPVAIVLANGEASALPGAQVTAATASASGLFSALLAGNFAAGQSAPLLISTRDVLPAPIASYLVSNAATIGTVYIIGSTSLISQAVEDAVVALVE